MTVVNPAPGGGTSNASAFSVAAPGENPVPAIINLSPAFITAGASGTLNLVILGSNFVPGAQAQWNGEDRPTTFVSAGQLRVAVSGADLVAPAQASVTVVNPAPGGGASNVTAFKVGSAGENPIPTLTKRDQHGRQRQRHADADADRQRLCGRRAGALEAAPTAQPPSSAPHR